MSDAKTVGVIGGLGPVATLDFFDRILKRTRAVREQEHLRLIIDNNTKIPDRNMHMRGEGPSPAAALASSARGLEQAGAEFIVMACNTAHAWEADIRAAISVPFLSMIDATVKETASLRPEAVGVLAGDACVAAQLYQHALEKAGVKYIMPDAGAQKSLMELIYRVKAGDTGETVRRSAATIARKLEARGAEVIIAGCTELPIVLTADDIDGELISSTEVLVEQTILFAGAELK